MTRKKAKQRSPANSNEPTQAWLDFRASEDFWECTACAPLLAWALKRKMPSESADIERTVSNFIWFLRFEKQQRESEVQVKRAQIQVIQ